MLCKCSRWSTAARSLEGAHAKALDAAACDEQEKMTSKARAASMSAFIAGVRSNDSCAALNNSAEYLAPAWTALSVSSLRKKFTMPTINISNNQLQAMASDSQGGTPTSKNSLTIES